MALTRATTSIFPSWRAFVLLMLRIIRAAATSRPAFAGASMKNALDDVNRMFSDRGGAKVTASYTASSALAKQLEQGAPADVFISADTDWMDYAVQHKLVRNDSRVDLLGNALVLVAPK